MVLKSCWKATKDLGKIYLLILNLKHFTYFGLEGVRNFKRFVWFLFDIASLRCASRLVFILTTLWPYWTCYWNIIQLIRNLLLCFPIVLIRFWNILILSDPAKKKGEICNGKLWQWDELLYDAKDFFVKNLLNWNIIVTFRWSIHLAGIRIYFILPVSDILSTFIAANWLTHSFPMHPFFTPWKYQKTLFSDVLMG